MKNFDYQSNELTLSKFFLKNVLSTDDLIVREIDNPVINVHYFYETPILENEIEEPIKMFKFTFSDDIGLQS